MTWHAQETSFTLRRFEAGHSFEKRDPYRSVATVFVLEEGVAFVHAFLNADRSPITREQWRELRDFLHAKGFNKVKADRHGLASIYETAPAPLGPR